jgi:hypothetical protein
MVATTGRYANICSYRTSTLRPAAELEVVLDRGELDSAIILAQEGADERGRPIDLDLALRFLPLVAAQRPTVYDDWASRWLARWISETPDATIERAAELPGALADLPSQQTAFERIVRFA